MNSPQTGHTSLDVLHRQVETPEPVTLISPFANIRKPTQLDPLEMDSQKKESLPEIILEDKKEDSKIYTELKTYIDSLTNKDRQLKMLKFDLDYPQTLFSVREVLSKACETGQISSEEEKIALDYI